ncbi:hypothetical protein GuL6_264 [Buttiauxella phage vB_ButM_GuL6]|nr:hypothetical protein GuL6_264 [Buttiauxella phage vB_ButM_GuL6]
MELLAGKTYGLTVSPEVFAEKTWKTGIAAIIRNKGYILIDRTSIGEFEDKAFVLDGEFEYEIPQSEWKWFKEVSPEAGEFVEKEPEVESDTKEMNGSIAQDITKLNIPNYTFKADGVGTFEIKPYTPYKNLDIQIAFGKSLEEIRVVPDPCDKSGEYLRFALQHLFNGGSIYYIDMEKSIDLQEEKIAELFNLHNRLEAVENIEKLLGKEKARILEDLKPYGKKNESRNLRNSRKHS